MPYRALPDSDVTRIAALDAAIAKAATLAPASLPYPATLQSRLTTEGPAFKSEVGEVGIALSAQGAATNHAGTSFLALQTIVSHFIQVLNLAIARGAMPREARPFYQLDLAGGALPPLVTQAEVVIWAGHLIAGEGPRITAGVGPAMSNPAIGEVQDALDIYTGSAATSTTAKDAYDSEQEDVAALRPTIDKLIKDIWDYVEFTYREEPGPSKRRKAREWGVVYVTRPGEEPDPEPEPENPAGDGNNETPPPVQ